MCFKRKGLIGINYATIKQIPIILLNAIIQIIIICLLVQTIYAQNFTEKTDYLKKVKSKMQVKKSLIKDSQSRLQYEKTRLSIINKQEQNLSHQLNKTEKDLWEVEENIRDIKLRRNKLKNEIASLKKDLEILKIKLIKGQKALASRLRAINMNREINYFAVILDSESFSDFISRIDYLQRIVNNDTSLIAEVRIKREQVKKEKKKLDELESELALLEMESRRKQAYFSNLRKTRSSILGVVKSQREQIADNVYELELLTRELEQQLVGLIRDAQSYNYGRTATRPIKSEGVFIWPVKGFISSNYGYRVHPIRGAVIFHSGLDIAAMFGAPVCSTASGIVIYSGWYGGYGNTVVVDHGNGWSSLYAHCSTLFVSRDQNVRQGDVLASVGSTGLSTGPHLHFEIRQGGMPIDPCSKL